jgi:hypothetical protein
MNIGEVATSTSRDQDFLPGAFATFDHRHATGAFASLDCAHEARCTPSENQNIKRLRQHRDRRFSLIGSLPRWDQRFLFHHAPIFNPVLYSLFMPLLERHIFICGNQRPPDHPRGSCAPKGNDELRKAFKQKLADHQVPGTRVRANKSGCLEQCEHGPTVVVYPDAIWYLRVHGGRRRQDH